MIFIVAIVSLTVAVFALIAQLIKFDIDWNKFFSPIAKVYEYKNQINKDVVLGIFLQENNGVLSKEAIESGYVVERRENSDCVYSNKVNMLLLNKAYDLPVTIKKKIVTEEEQIVLSSILKKYVDSKGNIYNDNLLGQATDLLIHILSEIILNKTCYFSNKATNDIVYSKFYSKSKQFYEFNGYRFALDSSNKLYDLAYSNATNIIGVSTMILTNDNHLILSIQNSNSDESAGLVVATGSGSAIVKDYQKGKTFYEFLTTGMERELVEETSNSLRYKDLSFWFKIFNYKIIKKYKSQEKELQEKIKGLFKANSTKVYCYNRILHRGGKPDFFGITRINLSSEEMFSLIDMCNNHTRMLLENELICFLRKDKNKINQILESYDLMISSLNKGDILDNGQSMIKEFFDLKKDMIKKNNSKYRPLEYENLGLFIISLEKIKNNLSNLKNHKVFSLQVEYMIKSLLKVIDKI